MVNKRGQSALEFLMTYGWAILIILVMIAALVYFGVFNPSRLTPEKCVAVPGFGCSDYQLRVGGLTSNFKLQNSKGDSVTLASATTFNMSNSQGWCSNTAGATSWGADQVLDVSFPSSCSASAGQPLYNIAVGDKAKVLISFDYTPKGGSFAKRGSVDVNAVVTT